MSVTQKEKEVELKDVPEENIEYLLYKDTDILYTPKPQEAPKKKRIPKEREKKMKKKDKVIHFMLHLINVVQIACTFGLPSYYPYMNAIVYTVLWFYRLWTFNKSGYQYYLIEFCYNVNLLVLLNLVYDNYYLFLVSYGLSMGPVCWTNFLYKHPIPFNDFEKWSSFWIHLSPALSMWLQRWHDPMKLWINKDKLESVQFDFSFFKQYFGSLTSVYLIWSIGYAFIIFVLRYKHILINQLENTYIYAFRKPKHFKTKKRVLKFGIKWAPLMFMWMHCRYIMGMACVSFFFYHYYYPSLLYLIVVYLSSIWYTATWDIDYFSYNYMKQFDDKEKEDQEYNAYYMTTNNSENKSLTGSYVSTKSDSRSIISNSKLD